MKKLICIILSFVMVFGAAALTSCNNSVKEKSLSKSKTLTEKYDSILKQFSFKGECYASAKGKEIYNKGIGFSDKENKFKNNEKTVFFIASVTKQFTAAAVMLLQERGKLSVKDKLSEYFPEYKYGGDITIGDMLCMRSGIPDYLNMETGSVFPENYNPYKHTAKENRAEIKKSIFSMPLNFKAGTEFDYTNGGYFLLAEIIEKVSGSSYKDFLRKEIFNKLGMKSAAFIDDKNVVCAYPENEKEDNRISYRIKGAAFGCGDMVSNAVDLIKWAEGFRNCKIVNKSSFKAMINPGKNKDYGYGLYISADKKSVYHHGHFTSYKSSLLISVDDTDFTCVNLSNYGFVQGNYINKYFKDKYDSRGNYGA